MKTHFWMSLLLIIHRTCQMSVCNHSAYQTHPLLKIHPVCHLSFLKTQRMNIFASHLPLYPIHHIMRMMTRNLNFLIFLVVISLLLHLIMMLIQSLLIDLRHWSTMIYLSMSQSWCLCQAIIVLRLVSLPVRKLLKHLDFSSSTWTTRSHRSCVGGILQNKHTFTM